MKRITKKQIMLIVFIGALLLLASELGQIFGMFLVNQAFMCGPRTQPLVNPNFTYNKCGTRTPVPTTTTLQTSVSTSTTTITAVQAIMEANSIYPDFNWTAKLPPNEIIELPYNNTTYINLSDYIPCKVQNSTDLVLRLCKK